MSIAHYGKESRATGSGSIHGGRNLGTASYIRVDQEAEGGTQSRLGIIFKACPKGTMSTT